MSVISPHALKQKALKLWQRGDLHRAELENIDFFPLKISLKNIPAKTLLADFQAIQAAIILLQKDAQKHGYQLAQKTLEHRQLGHQSLPCAVVFQQANDFLNYLGLRKTFSTFQALSQISLQQEPLLLNWLLRYPLKVTQYAEQWQQLLTICAYFKHHPHPQIYLRQLDIAGIDTKFIEQHKAILSELLTALLPQHHFNTAITGLNQHGFERRYGLRYDPPLIRLRILDKHHAIQGLTDLSLSHAEFLQLDLNIKTVFISENKITGLAFPSFPNAIIIFGLGYSINLLKGATCLQNKVIYYWGDIDTHGFAILARLRHAYPQAQSLLMNQTTLNAFQNLGVIESSQTAEQKTLDYLSAAEKKLYQTLQNSQQRLEQERIGFNYLQTHLDTLR